MTDSFFLEVETFVFISSVEKYDEVAELGFFSRNLVDFCDCFPSTMLAKELVCRLLDLAFEATSIPATLPFSIRYNTAIIVFS